MHVKQDYRPDIDGLRAVAVLSVILYHINHAWVPGGYVGVDIFFVISGFLITRNIASELADDRFALANFYLRRVRRIAPAFLLVTAATLVAGIFLLLPDDMIRLAKSAIWATFSSANIYYWKYLDTSYFAAATAQEPLLHMWSLGVEEQFYLLWPVLLIFLHRITGRRALLYIVALAICVSSFVLAEATNVHAQKFSYYMLPTRAGELMVGALLALFLLSQALKQKPTEKLGPLGDVISITGLGMLVYSFWKLSDSSQFPGINAVYPCLGAALVIFGGYLGAFTNRFLLAPKPVVWVGLISYSMYLWHWPILAYLRYFFGDVSTTHGVAALILTLALSIASYKLVEQPARKVRRSGWGQVIRLWAMPAVCLVLVSGLLIHFQGLRAIMQGSQAQALELETAPADRSQYPCMDPRASVSEALQEPACVIGAKGNGPRMPNVFVWGDSNAGHYLGVIDAIAKDSGFDFRYVALSTCPSLFGSAPYGAAYVRDRCDAFRETVRAYLRRSPVETVVLASQWTVHDGLVPSFEHDIEATVAELVASGKHVVILGQVPGFPRYNRDCPRRWARLDSPHCPSDQSKMAVTDFSTNNYLKSLADRLSGVTYLNARNVLCKDNLCSPYIGGVPVYFNPTHLSASGSERIGQAILKTAEGAEWRRALGRPESLGNS